MWIAQGTGQMRISGGTAKGRKVGLKKGDASIRPTSMKVRKAIFDILREKVVDCIFLDLYAGTGAVGIEAISRGAGFVVFVDKDGARIKTIKGLIEKFSFKDKARFFIENALDFLKKTKMTFDVIFVDPPYASLELNEVLPLIDKKDILNNNGFVIAEHSSKKTLPLIIGKLKLAKTYKYGDTALSLYREE